MSVSSESAGEARNRDTASAQAEERRARVGGKSAAAFRTISEVSAELEVPQHVLRFWESKFTQLRPLKRGGGRRYYRPEDVALLRRIHGLLYREGYTIKGVQRVLKGPRSGGPDEAAADLQAGPAEPAVADLLAPDRAGARERLLRDVLAELKVLRALLD
jgi:DNA-binding transcriptional MerR regulator